MVMARSRLKRLKNQRNRRTLKVLRNRWRLEQMKVMMIKPNRLMIKKQKKSRKQNDQVYHS